MIDLADLAEMIVHDLEQVQGEADEAPLDPNVRVRLDAGEPERMTEIPADILSFWAHNAIQGKKGFQPTGGDGEGSGGLSGTNLEAATGAVDAYVQGVQPGSAMNRGGIEVVLANLPPAKAASAIAAGMAGAAPSHLPISAARRQEHAAAIEAIVVHYKNRPPLWESLPAGTFTKISTSEWSALASEAFAEHSGAMIAFMLPDAVAARLALPGGEASGDLHLTLAYLTNDAASVEQETRAKWYDALSAAGKATGSMLARISGVGRFNPMDSSDGEPVVYASVDAPGLSAFRVLLVEELEKRGIDIPADHDFTPHVTLAYGNRPLPEIPTLDMRIDRITLVVGGEKHDCLLPDSVAASEPYRFWANNAVKGKKGFQPTNRGEGGTGPQGAAADTMQQFASGGDWDPDREAFVHEPALREIREKGGTVLEGEEAPGKPPVVESPTLYMTGGGYGSGKSTLLGNPELIGFPKKGKATHVDPDKLKSRVPEFEERVKKGDKGAASFVHEESSYLAKRATALSLQRGNHTIYDTSGDSDISKLHAKVQEMRALGARKVNADYATPGSFQEAIRRVDARAARAGPARRDIPPAAVIANHAAVSRAWTGAAAAGTFDRLRLWSTAGPFGSRPKLVAIATGGKVRVRDRAAYDAFVAMGHPSSMTQTWLGLPK